MLRDTVMVLTERGAGLSSGGRLVNWKGERVR